MMTPSHILLVLAVVGAVAAWVSWLRLRSRSACTKRAGQLRQQQMDAVAARVAQRQVALESHSANRWHFKHRRRRMRFEFWNELVESGVECSRDEADQFIDARVWQ